MRAAPFRRRPRCFCGPGIPDRRPPGLARIEPVYCSLPRVYRAKGHRMAAVGRLEERAMRSRVLVVAALACSAFLLSAAGAQAEETVSITEAGFSPAKLGMPTNAFGRATIGSTTGPVPSPITHVNVYGPAGVTLDLRGTGVCKKEKLENQGPKACPANSRAGFGGGMGIYKLGQELVEEEYTLDFFL